MSVEIISLSVELDKTQVAAKAAVGHGFSKSAVGNANLQKLNIHQYVCFCSARMLTSTMITESVENHFECCGCVNSCNKFVLNRSC